MSQKIVICGAGFIGFNIAKVLTSIKPSSGLRRVQISSRSPHAVQSRLRGLTQSDALLPAVPADIMKPATLAAAFEGADVVISLVGILHGTPKQFEQVQWKGAQNVAQEAKKVGAKLIHFSAIGADVNSHIPYARTKALGENSVLDICPDATVIRPSLVFGPGDDFFTRFARLSSILPFLPVFGGGLSLFQPVYVEDIALAVEAISRPDPDIRSLVAGKVIEAGGPDIFTYKEMMELVLQHTKRRRIIVSVPFMVGSFLGGILEHLPANIFTVTRSQVEQLKSDNVVDPLPSPNRVSFSGLLEKYSKLPLRSIRDILPLYL